MFKNIIYFILTIFIILPHSLASSSLLQEKKDKLYLHRLRLREEKARLYYANLKEDRYSRQLYNMQQKYYEVYNKATQTAILIKQTERELCHLKTKLASAEKEYYQTQKGVEANLCKFYENINLNYLSVLLNTHSFAEFVNYSYYLKLILKEEYKELFQLKEKQEEIAREKAEVEKKYQRLIALKEEYNSKQEEFEKLVAIQKYYLNQVQREREEYAQNVSYLEHSTKRLEQEIQNIINSSASPRSYMRGRLIWPVSGGSVTSPFGWRVHPIFGTWKFHSGIDIGADYGASIYAAQSGVVVYSGWLEGYGWTVIIDHGGGISTLYAHCSSIYVSCGQRVSCGQTIALVGSTGYSTGPHLHFEVRKNGIAVNPLQAF